MKVLSTNIATPREIVRNGKSVVTGIYKEPVDSITIRKFFVEGDTVSDTRVHGGERKAVYVYASEHYPFWQSEFPGMTMPWGTFGENITSEGLLEQDLLVGSVYRFGTALLKVTAPRFPCMTLKAKFGVDDMIERFLHSRKSGSYFTVIEEGVVRADDPIILLEQGETDQSILDLVEEKVARSSDDRL